MKAVVVTEQGKIAVVNDCPMPAVGPYDALVRIETCGFCNGTDTRIINGEMSCEQGLRAYPTLLGHEAAGVIVEVGPKVRHLGVGEKHIHIQGADPAGRPYTSTHGQMAEYGTLTDYAAMQEDGLAVPAGAPLKPSRLPDDFDLVDAGVLLPLCECLSAVKNFGIDGGTDVLVYGAGPMGLAMMRYMRILGARRSPVSIPCPSGWTRRCGPGWIAPRHAQVSVRCPERPAFDRVVDAVGLSAGIMEGTRRLRPYGVV
jgi:threonine dehydrogenase-like Zn-dependent dehydrogenase